MTRSRKRWLVLGLTLIGLGAGMAGLGAWQATSGLVAAGLVTGQLGLVLCTPALIGLVAQTGRLVPLAPRIAMRDTARNRAAAALALSAVLAAVAGTLTVGIYAVGEDHRIDADYVTGAAIGSVSVRYDLVEPGFRRSLADLHGQVVAALPGVLPVERLAEVRVPGCSPGVGTGAVCEVRAVASEQNACPWLSLERELTAAE